MLDKHLQISRHYFKVIDSKPIHIKVFGDLHYCKSFQDDKLDKIKKELKQSPTDYVCVVGDLIDSTNYLYSNKEKKDILIRWLTELGEQYKIFLTFGNHDFTYYKGKEAIKDIPKEFFEELKNISGLYMSHYEPYYEDESVIIYQLELNFEYYGKGSENIDILLETLEMQKEKLTNLDRRKVKILMVHSPILITHPKVLEYIKAFDFIVTGHMHNGLVHPFISKFIPGNKGIISPNKQLFSEYARGIKTIKLEDKNINLIINGGIIKIQECAPYYLNLLNCFFPMQMDEIVINDKQRLIYRNK